MAYTWTDPKTDWTAGTGTTPYDGDTFSYVDFNRIKNNVMYLYELAVQVYDISSEVASREARGAIAPYFFVLQDGYTNRTANDFVYADEINFFEQRLHFLNQTCGTLMPFSPQTYYANGTFINATELNKLETLAETLRGYIFEMFISRRRFAITFQQKANHIDL